MAYLGYYCSGFILLRHNLDSKDPFINIIVLKLSLLPILCGGFKGLFELSGRYLNVFPSSFSDS